MFNRREIMAGGVLTGAFLSSSASACRVPAPKDRKGYAAAISRLFGAWWARDHNRFLKVFQDAERGEPLPDRTLFDAHFVEPASRFRGQLLFSGASAVVQVITPQEANAERGFCGGYAKSDLFLVKFYPGLERPVVRSVQFLDTDLLASSEWNNLAG